MRLRIDPWTLSCTELRLPEFLKCLWLEWAWLSTQREPPVGENVQQKEIYLTKEAPHYKKCTSCFSIIYRKHRHPFGYSVPSFLLLVQVPSKTLSVDFAPFWVLVESQTLKLLSLQFLEVSQLLSGYQKTSKKTKDTRCATVNLTVISLVIFIYLTFTFKWKIEKKC